MSGQSSGVVCPNGDESASDTSLCGVSQSEDSSLQDSAVELLLPPVANSHTPATYGAVATVGDNIITESLAGERHCCILTKRASAVIERLCLVLAIVGVLGLFSLPVAYRYVALVSMP